MADFYSKYTGEQVDALLDIVSQGGVGGGGGEGEVQKTTEAEITAMGFTKNLGTITEVKMNGVTKGTSGVVDLGTVITSHQDISGKVDKVAGKGLSTNDFTDDDKDRLDDLIDWYPSADEDISYLMSNAAEIYKTEFDINDIYTIYSDQTSLVSCGKDKIVRAVKDGKVICVPYSKDDLFLGYIIADVTIEDLLYINLMGVNGDCFYISTDYQSGPSLFAEEITYYSFKDKQDKLVSGTNIKTVNGTSILGSGDIAISGGGGGTITGVYANGTSIATSGVANIPAASTSAYGVTKLSSATNSTSTTLAATASAVKSAYDLANSYKGTVTGVKINGTTKSPTSGTVDLGTVITSHQDISGKQDKLVSGTNIKTINGTSILGSGNITISGGSSGGGSGAYAQVNHGASDTTFTLTPNTFHVWDEISALTLSFGDETAGVANEFVFQFTSGSTATSLTLPDGIKWVNDTVPTISENKIYQISVLNNLAAALEFSNEVQLPVNRATWVEGDMMSGGTLTFQYPVASDLTITSMYTVVDTVIMAGETSVTIMWDEPMAPVPYSITPEKDNTYKYEL